MTTMAALLAQRGETIDKLTTLAAEGPAKFKEFDETKVSLAGLDGQIARLKEATALSASLAKPAEGQGQARATIPAEARRTYGKLVAYKGDNAAESAFRVGRFIQATILGDKSALAWCRDNGIAVEKAQAEGVNSAGGELVPEEMMAAIIDLRETYGVFRQQAQLVPMSRDTLNWPRRTGGVSAYFVNENTAPTESQSSWDNVNLTAKKLAALVRMSTEISDDAIINIADWLTNEIAYAFSAKEDDCGFNGDGTSTYGGIRGLTKLAVDGNHNAGKFTAAGGHNTFALLDQVDLTGLMGTLPYYALKNAKFYCSQLAFATCFERLIATAGGNTINTLNGEIVYQYLGFPIVIAQKLPAVGTSLTGQAMMFFGDLRRAAAMGERRQVTIKQSTDRYFDQDQVGILGTERIDINVHDMGDNVTAGPLVALVAP